MNLDIHIANLDCFNKHEKAETIFQLESDFDHTMSQGLYNYVEKKIHHTVDLAEEKTTFITDYERVDSDNITISDKEKSNKLFNWQRPTYNKETKQFTIVPGNDYLFHYTLLHNYWKNKQVSNIKLQDVSELELPTVEFGTIWDSLKLPHKLNSTVILGHVESVKNLSFAEWTEFRDNYKAGGNFGYSNHISKDISLLGCFHSIWGDIAETLVYKLASYGVKNILYIGKLHSLNEVNAPKSAIVSGSKTYIQGELIDFSSIDLCKDLKVNKVTHYNLPSPMLETKAWAVKARSQFDITDNKIGYMARQALKCGINFGHIDLITNYMFNRDNEEAFYNSREFKGKKDKAFFNIKDLINQLPI